MKNIILKYLRHNFRNGRMCSSRNYFYNKKALNINLGF